MPGLGGGVGRWPSSASASASSASSAGLLRGVFLYVETITGFLPCRGITSRSTACLRFTASATSSGVIRMATASGRHLG